MEEWDNDNVVSCHGYNIQPLQRRVYRGPILRVGNFKVRLWNVVAALYPLPRCLFFLNVFFFLGKEGGNPTTSRQICLSPSSVRFIAIHTTTPLSIFTFESTFAQFERIRCCHDAYFYHCWCKRCGGGVNPVYTHTSEDPSVFVDKRGNYHMLVNALPGGCNPKLQQGGTCDNSLASPSHPVRFLF